MKKLFCIIAFLIVPILLMSCGNSTIVELGSELVRADFYFYDSNGKITQKVDENEEGCAFLWEGEQTARGIKLGSTEEEAMKAYIKDWAPNSAGSAEMTDEDGYRLTIHVKEGKVDLVKSETDYAAAIFDAKWMRK